MDKGKLNYTPAFAHEKRGYFRIIFYWRDDYTKPLERFRPTFNLNRIKDLKIRRQAAKVMADTVTELLKEGWNPITGEVAKLKEIQTAAVKQSQDYEMPAQIDIISVLTNANKSLLKRSNKDRTHTSYNSLLKLFCDYLKQKKINEIPITEFSVSMAFDYADWLFEKGYAPRTINSKIDFISGRFDYLKDKEQISKNPFANIRRANEIEQDLDEEDALFTLSELRIMKQHLLKCFPELWQYFLFIFYCLMRPDSIMNIKMEDIDLKNGKIRVLPENHKNSKKAYKQLLTPHLKYLIPYLASLGPLNNSDYLFSKKMKPGPNFQPPTRAAEFWRQYVKEQLGIKKNAYNAKHTFGTNYIDHNPGSEDLKWLQNQMSHGDLQSTSVYVAKRKKIKLDESQANIIEI